MRTVLYTTNLAVYPNTSDMNELSEMPHKNEEGIENV